jgi:hypothetical protein
MKRPLRRVDDPRSSDNQKRKLRTPTPAPGELAALVHRARFEGSGKHKAVPRAFGLEPTSPAADDTLCDEHADFSPADMARLPTLLERGILAGLISERDTQGDPAILWTVDDNGWIYEARITTQTQAVYHGYPLLPGDAFARKVISRYNEYARDRPLLRLEQSVENALERYR